jgi:hypothetical protein
MAKTQTKTEATPENVGVKTRENAAAVRSIGQQTSCCIPESNLNSGRSNDAASRKWMGIHHT